MRIQLNGMKTSKPPRTKLAGRGPWPRFQHVADTDAEAVAAVAQQRA